MLLSLQQPCLVVPVKGAGTQALGAPKGMTEKILRGRALRDREKKALRKTITHTSKPMLGHLVNSSSITYQGKGKLTPTHAHQLSLSTAVGMW